MWIDTHAHLTDERLRADLPSVIDRARAAGVEQIVCVATTAGDSVTGIEVSRLFPDIVSPSVGIHPNHAAEAAPGDWDAIVKLASARGVVALGETGLDRHWDFTPFDVQKDYFARHLQLSRLTGLPVIVHCREAEADVLRIMGDDYRRSGPVRGVLHSYCGPWEVAESALAMGLYVSFAGMLTYKTADDVRSVAARVPADRLLVETDCPYLAPVPVRGRTNEPAYVAHTAARLAEVRGVSPVSLAGLTSANARQLFFPNG